MRKYNQNQEVDWKWLIKFLEVELNLQMLHYFRKKEEDSPEARQAYLNNLLSFYISLRSFLKLSSITKTRNRAEDFIKNGLGNRW